MAAGGVSSSDSGSKSGGSTTSSSSTSDKASKASYSQADKQAKDNGKKSESKAEQRTSNGQNGHASSVKEQGQKARDFDAVQGRPTLDEQQVNAISSSLASVNGDGRTRSDADMQARVDAYQQDFDQTLNNKIETIDKELKTVGQRLERAAGHNKRNLAQRKENLTEQRQNLQKLADSPDDARQKEFEAYQWQFDQAVNDQTTGVDKELAAVDRQLEGASGHRKRNLNSKRQKLTEQRAELQKIADTPDAALESLKARHERENSGWTASDVGHLALDVVGLVPGLGNLADGANAAWYTAEGRYGDAALSAGGAVVGAGIGVTIAKWFGKGAKSADDVAGAAKGPDAPSGKTETPDSRKVEGASKAASRPQIEVEHILDGEINRRGKAVGYHHRAQGTDTSSARMTSPKAPPDVNDVYKGSVEIRNPSTGQWVAKRSDSTFYPNEMSRDEVVAAIEKAWDNKTVYDADGFSSGPSGRGFNIEGYARDGKIVTAYPIHADDVVK